MQAAMIEISTIKIETIGINTGESSTITNSDVISRMAIAAFEDVGIAAAAAMASFGDIFSIFQEAIDHQEYKQKSLALSQELPSFDLNMPMDEYDTQPSPAGFVYIGNDTWLPKKLYAKRQQVQRSEASRPQRFLWPGPKPRNPSFERWTRQK
jgi:hypothetical protein